MSHNKGAYEELRALRRRAGTLGSVGSLLNWDQETYMPPAAAGHRAEQSALLAGLVHERLTDPRVGELLAACEADAAIRADAAASANVREMRRDYDRETRLPKDLVEEIARVGSQSQEAWKEARAKDDFPMFAPWLGKMVGLMRRKAECLGVPRGGESYDALMDEYEPGATAKMIEGVFTPLRARLSTFIGEAAGKGRQPDVAPLGVKIDPARQHEFGLQVLGTMGFDLGAGRLDVTTHPFCSGMAPGDTRLTTRYRDEKFTDALYGTMHEAGHGLYEQGLPKGEYFGEPLGEAVSLGMHESQSRLWENFVGRSREFWAWALPRTRGTLGLKGSVEDYFRATNTAMPTFIRVEADEATYNLHVMLRFELERGLIGGTLAVNDVPGEWNKAVETYLGLRVPDNRRGCLQDVHWSFGLFGYFPTYTLGNLYAAQLWEAYTAKEPGFASAIERGEWLGLRDWLRATVHVHGRRFPAAELCKRATGKELSADPLMRHLERKLRPILGI